MKPARKFSAALTLVALVAALWTCSSHRAFSADTWTPGAGWTLIWGDEFVGPAIDSTNWGYDLGGGGWGNNELETYTSTNAYIQNGELIISAVRQANGSYTSSRLKTQGKRSWKYGKVAARLRLPYGQGIWPAFWMLGDNISSVGWPKCGETDIMEMIGGGENRDDTTYGTIHWDQNNSHQSVGSSGRELPDPQFFYQDYHVFEIEWSSSLIIWKLDGVEFFRTSVDITQFPNREEFHQPFFIILNCAVGGNWPGYPDGTTVFPQFMYIDWVRVYQADATPPVPPVAPTLLTASSPKQPRRINLAWTQSTSAGLTQNRIYRSSSGPSGPYSLRATISPATKYTDTGLTSGQTYYYAITAVNSGGESPYSNYNGATAK
jgi:beta-glucanase (GH16 family)